MSNKSKIFLFFALLMLFNLSFQKPNEKKETCDENSSEEKAKLDMEKNYQLKYSELFLNQPNPTYKNKSGLNSTSYFDFSINDKILKYIEQNGVIPYPRARLRGKDQGNFLHFMHLAYERNLPIYFTIDQIIYPYIEITKELSYNIIQYGFYKIFSKFLQNLINYGKKNKYDKSLLLYLEIGSKFLEEEKDNKKKSNNTSTYEELSMSIVDSILNLEKENDDIQADSDDYFYNFTLLGSKRSINKYNFIKMKNKGLKGNKIAQKITNSLRYFQDFIFDISKELFNVYMIGKLINESGQEKIYKKIKRFTNYLFNEQEEVMNPLEIFFLIKNNHKSIKEEKDSINNLFKEIKGNIIKNSSLSFLYNITFDNKENEKKYIEDKVREINLFSYSSTIDDWINFNLISNKKMRLFTSIYEYIDIVHHGTLMRKAIMERYHYNNNNKNDKNINARFLQFRDGINMEKEFNEMKVIIENSMKEERNKWKNTYENSFNYLLNFIGHNTESQEKYNNVKTFNTLLGSYVHFKKDIMLIKQNVNFTYSTKGSFPDIIFENNTKFYQEIKNLTKIFQEHLLDIVSNLIEENLKTKLIGMINFKLNTLYTSYDNIIKLLQFQNKGINNNEKQIILSDMFYYNKTMKEYNGWYVDLYRDNDGKADYSLGIYGYNYFISDPIEQFNFKGAIVLAAMNYPELGLIVKKDSNKGKKLLLFSSYIANEYQSEWNEKINFKELQKLIVERKY